MYKKIKFKNYEALFIHTNGKRTSGEFDFLGEAVRYFKAHPTTSRMILFKATHNNTRLKKIGNYDSILKF